MAKKLPAPKITAPATAAGGVSSLTTAAKQVWQKSDLTNGIKAVKSMNKISGFDCPGCAWPTAPEEALSVEICENGIKALAEEISPHNADREFFAKYSLADLRGENDYQLGLHGRLSEPMIIRHGETNYQPISWDSALQIIADQLQQLDNPNQATFYTSGRTSNEAAFLYQLLARQFGTNNLPDSADLCHEASGIALGDTIGIGKGSVKIEDFYQADAIFIFGQNPGSNHPRMLKALQKAAANGCKIISINPLREAGLMRFKNPQHLSGLIGNGSALSDLILQVKINGDYALISGILKAVLEHAAQHDNHGLDKKFIETYTANFSEFCQTIANLSWDDITHHSGISKELIVAAAEIFCNSKKVIACWAMGLTQHHNGVDTIKQLVNLLLLGGHVGKPGAGVCPVRGHSNVQGDKTMGITEKPQAYIQEGLPRVFGVTPPSAYGDDTITTIEKLANGEIKTLIMLGGNLLMAAPATTDTAKALQQAKLTVHIATKLNHTHLYPGKIGIILPALSRSEKDLANGTVQVVSVENSMGIVHRSAGVLEPCSPLLKSEVAIICKLAGKLFKTSSVAWTEFMNNYDLIREKISQVIPGFTDFNQKLVDPGWFYLPNSVRDQRKFATASGKANFTPNLGISTLPLAADEFLLMTTRSHDQFNTTISGMDDRYRGIYNTRMIVFMNSEDINELGISSGEQVMIQNSAHPQMKLDRMTVVAYDIPKRCLAGYFPETNVLIPLDSIDPQSRTPTSKSIVVKIVK